MLQNPEAATLTSLPHKAFSRQTKAYIPLFRYRMEGTGFSWRNLLVAMTSKTSGGFQSLYAGTLVIPALSLPRTSFHFDARAYEKKLRRAQ
jgi:hypothetical protein